MDNLDDIKKTWLTANTDQLPDADKMVQMIRNFRKRRLLKTIGLVIVSVILTMLMIDNVFTGDSVMLTTRIGNACMLIAAMILTNTSSGFLRNLYKWKSYSNKEFVEYIEQARAAKILYYKKTQLIGLSFVSIGLLLSLFEIVCLQTPLYCIMAYMLLLAFLLVLWFILRPWTFNRHIKKLDDALKQAEIISKQF